MVDGTLLSAITDGERTSVIKVLMYSHLPLFSLRTTQLRTSLVDTQPVGFYTSLSEHMSWIKTQFQYPKPYYEYKDLKVQFLCNLTVQFLINLSRWSKTKYFTIIQLAPTMVSHISYKQKLHFRFQRRTNNSPYKLATIGQRSDSTTHTSFTIHLSKETILKEFCWILGSPKIKK